MRRVFLTILSLAMLPVSAFAHGDAPSFEKEIGDLLIDIGYNVQGFRPGEPVTFDFNLFNIADVWQYEPFRTVVVAISQDGEQIFSQPLENQPSVIPSLTYTFPEEGNYALHASFERHLEETIDVSFPITVSKNAGALGRLSNTIHYGFAAGILIFGAGIAVQSYRNKQKSPKS